MPPVKKRKRNADNAAGQPRGLEYFFSKQREAASPVVDSSDDAGSGADLAAVTEQLTDEELARKLQAEWDEELRQERQERQEQQEQPETDAMQQLADVEPEAQAKAVVADELQQEAVDAAHAPNAPSKNTLSLLSVATADDDNAVTDTIPLDESPLTFDLSKYTPLLQQQWQWQGSSAGSATYALLTRCFVLVNATQSRIKIVDTLVNCLRVLIEADPDSLLPAVWLATNAIGPPYAASLELGLGSSAISRALKQACGLDARALKALYDRHGDAGDVAYEAKTKNKKSRQSTLMMLRQRPRPPLTIRGVYDALQRIAASRGPGSADAKQRIVDRLLQDARGGDESRYLVRTLCQHLRIGAVKTTMLIALSRAFLLSRPPPPKTETETETDAEPDGNVSHNMYSPSALARMTKDDRTAVWARAEETVKACFARRPNYNDLVPALLDLGVRDDLPVLARCGLALHIPLRPMLGSITRDLPDMLAKLQGRAFTCEYKYDGQRAQVHVDGHGSKVSIFSRHLENMTDKYPDLVALMPQVCGAGIDSCILEGEVVAVDAATGQLLPFQTLTGRARKDVALGSVTVRVCLFAFDLMFLNGQPLLDRPLRARRALLRSLFVEVPRQFTWVQSMDATSDDGDAISEFFRGAVQQKCEGIMVKVLDAEARAVATAAGEEKSEEKSRRKPLLTTYEPDKRLDSWLKVKKDYGATSDTLDLVPVAAWHGTGRKAAWWSPILMAVRNDDTGALEAVTKCMSGFSDAFYKENRAFYGGDDNNDNDNDNDNDNNNTDNIHLTKPAYVEYSGPPPDVWFEPCEVWEMAFADITLSPTYTAAIGLVSDARGLSLRFPRFLRKRPDKGIDEASTGAFLASLYRKQGAEHD